MFFNFFQYKFPDTTFLEFETITLVPYEPHLIKFELLSEAQVSYLRAKALQTF